MEYPSKSINQVILPTPISQRSDKVRCLTPGLFGKATKSAICAINVTANCQIALANLRLLHDDASKELPRHQL
jgi:hypothetical protein